MPVSTFIIGPDGQVTVEGIEPEELEEFLGEAVEVNCGRPYTPTPVPPQPKPPKSPAPPIPTDGAAINVHRIYHGSVVDGPGVRSVLQVQGCPIRCKGCYAQDTWAYEGTVLTSKQAVLATLLQPQEVRDGVTIMGGEPMFQAEALVPVARELRASSIDIVLYTGYTVDFIKRHGTPAQNELLDLADTVIDGPFVQALADEAGEYKGSRNQRIRTKEELAA